MRERSRGVHAAGCDAMRSKLATAHNFGEVVVDRHQKLLQLA